MLPRIKKTHQDPHKKANYSPVYLRSSTTAIRMPISPSPRFSDKYLPMHNQKVKKLQKKFEKDNKDEETKFFGLLEDLRQG